MNIEIKGKTYNGSVTVYDQFTLPQVELIEAAMFAEVPYTEKKEKDESGNEKTLRYVRMTEDDKSKLPAVLACVENWELSNFPKDLSILTFPLSPRRTTHNLIKKIFNEIEKIYNGELDIPNE